MYIPNESTMSDNNFGEIFLMFLFPSFVIESVYHFFIVSRVVLAVFPWKIIMYVCNLSCNLTVTDMDLQVLGDLREKSLHHPNRSVSPLVSWMFMDRGDQPSGKSHTCLLPILYLKKYDPQNRGTSTQRACQAKL